MKNRIIALALVIVMLFALSACSMFSKQTAPEPTAAPTTAAPTTAAPTATPVPETPAPTPVPTPKGVEPDSGVHSIVSQAKGFSIDYDSKYVANELPSGAIIINAGTSEGIPYVTVSIPEKELMGQENAVDATAYLLDLSKSVVEELGDSITNAPMQLPSLLEGRDMIGFAYSYQNPDVGGNVVCTYFAENLDSGEVVVYSANSSEADIDTVNAIMKLAAETFKIAL